MDKNYIVVGAYTENSSSEGISIFEINSETGELMEQTTVKCTNPSFLKVYDNLIFAVSEVDKKGCLMTFEWNRSLNTIEKKSEIETKGGASCYLDVWKKLNFISIANYASGIYATCSVDETGSLKEVTDVKENEGMGPNQERQTQAHAHSITADQNRNYFIGADLGSDTLYIYRADEKTGKLIPNEHQPSIRVSPGEGPRHLAFHKNNKYVYAVTELKNSLITYSFHEETGVLQELEKITLVNEGEQGGCYGADLHISKDGMFLYTSVRGADCIFAHQIDEKTGLLSLVGEYRSGGRWPRNFCITPDDQYIIAANQNSGNIVVFRRDQISGALSEEVFEVKMEQPVCVVPFYAG